MRSFPPGTPGRLCAPALRAAGLLTIVGIAFSAGCRHDRLVRPSDAGANTRISALAHQLDVRPEEAMFAALAFDVPSSAGFFLDDRGRVVVVVRDQHDDPAAVASTRRVLASSSRDAVVRSGDIVIQRGEYTFFQLAGWRDLVFDDILGRIEGVVSLDLSETDNRVVIGLSGAVTSFQHSAILQELAQVGIDTQAVLLRTMSPEQSTEVSSFDFRGGRFADSVATFAHWDTIVGGVPIAWKEVIHPSVPSYIIRGCTAGVVVDRGSVRGVVAASHCSNVYWGLDLAFQDGRIFQPDTMRPIAVEHTDPQGWSCGFLGVDECRNSDASFFSTYSGITTTRGLIARTLASAGPSSGNGSFIVDQARPYFIIDDVDDGQMIVGQHVHKVGKTTGWTWGVITDTCVDYVKGFVPDRQIAPCMYMSDMTVD